MSGSRSQARSGLNLDALRFDAGFLHTLIEGLLVVDDDGVITDCNSAATEMLMLDADELIGSSPFESRWATVFADGTPVRPDTHPVTTVLQTGESRRDVVLGLDLPGTRRWLRTDTRPFTTGGRSRGAVVRFVDVTGQMQRERNLRLLLEITRLAASCTEVLEFLQNLCSTLVELGRCSLVCITAEGDQERGDLEIIAAAGATEFLYAGEDGPFVPERVEFHSMMLALRSRELQVENDLASLPAYDPLRARALAFGFKSVAAITVNLGPRDAVLTLYAAHANSFDELAVHALDAAAKDIEFGMAHMLAIQELGASLDGTLAALSRVTDSRDPYTAGHQARVGALGAAIASRLGLHPSIVRLVRQSGEVHDIGKIAVPAEILTRPGNLNPLEFEMIKGHSSIGGDILAKASLPWPIAEVALQHHERLDGSGYPNGLSGEEISLPARIIAVADVVEAMTQHRPYRAALGLDRALAEVVEKAGTKYDAEVVAACVAVFEDGFVFDSTWGHQVEEDQITQ